MIVRIKKFMEKAKKEILKVILGIKNLKFLERFLKDLLTPAEFKEIIKRWQVVNRLFKKVSYRDITQELKAGRATVTRGSRVLLNKNSAFNKILEKKK